MAKINNSILYAYMQRHNRSKMFANKRNDFGRPTNTPKEMLNAIPYLKLADVQKLATKITKEDIDSINEIAKQAYILQCKKLEEALDIIQKYQ